MDKIRAAFCSARFCIICGGSGGTTHDLVGDMAALEIFGELTREKNDPCRELNKSFFKLIRQRNFVNHGLRHRQLGFRSDKN